MTDFTGTPGPDLLTGTAGDDRFRLEQGGDDNVSGAGGNDGFYFGRAFSGADRVDGGAGFDTLALQGDYFGLQLGAVSAVEVLLVLSGADTRFGDLANNRYRYEIRTQDSNVAAGGTLTVQASGLLASEWITFDGSAETGGSFRVFAGRGVDYLTGGSGNDGFFFGNDGNLTGADRIDGGGGIDSVALRGDYGSNRAVFFQAGSLRNVETLVFLSGHTNEYGGVIDPDGFDYDVTMADANVAAGQRLDVIAGTLRSDERLVFDGSAETDGAFRIIAGAGNDDLYGGDGNDQIFGRDGDDLIDPGRGADAVDGGAGDDILGFGSRLTAADSVVGGSGTDSLFIGGRSYSDVDFTNVSSVEELFIETAGHVYALGGEAAAAGMSTIVDVSNGGNVIDASAMSGSFALTISGGAGADDIYLGDVASNTLLYRHRSDSTVWNYDIVYDFVSGTDRIDVRQIDNPYDLDRIDWAGNVFGHAAAERALIGFDGELDVVYDQANQALWFNLNDDEWLDERDLVIILDGVGSLQGIDVYDGAILI